MPEPTKRGRGRPPKSDFTAPSYQKTRQIYDERGNSAERIMEVRQKDREALLREGDIAVRMGIVHLYAGIMRTMLEQLKERYPIPFCSEKMRSMIVITRNSTREEVLQKLLGYPDYILSLSLAISTASIAAYFLVGRSVVVSLGERYPEIFDPISAIIQMRYEELAEAAKNPAWFIYLSKNNFGSVYQFRDTQDIQITGGGRDVDNRRILEALKDVSYPESDLEDSSQRTDSPYLPENSPD